MLGTEIFDTTADDPHADKPDSLTGGVLALSVPPEIIICTGPNERLRSREEPAHAEFKFFFEFRYAPVIQDVFQTSQFSVCSISEIPVDAYNCRANLKKFFTAGANGANRIRQPGMRRLNAGALPHAPARQNRKAFQLPRLEVRHNANVVRVKIRGVIAH